MTDNPQKSLDRLIARVDEDRWLSSRYAPAPQREGLIALYGLNHELARIRLAVSEPALGAIRFQWWREALEGAGDPGRAGRHPVTAVLAPVLAAGALAAGDLLALVDGYQDAFETGDRAREPEGALALLAAGLVGSGETMDRAWVEGAAADFAAARRGEATGGDGLAARRERVAPPLRPALAHLALRRAYRGPRPPSAFTKRLAVLGAVLTGRV